MKILLTLLAVIFFLLFNNSYSQVYLGMIEKEGIFISDTLLRSKMDYGKLEQYLKKMNAAPGQNYVISQAENEFARLSNIKFGQKFFVTCRDNVTSEEVAGFVVFDFYDISQEFYPMLSNRSNLCKHVTGDHGNFNKNIVIISSDTIKNRINYIPSANDDLLTVFKKRVLEDAKKFEVYADDMNTTKKPITEVMNDNIVFFKGSFTAKNTEQFFVSYLLQNSDTFINANYVMNDKGEVMDFFTTPRNEFEYRQIEGICDRE